MHIRAIASSAAFIAGLAALPLAPAKAQNYYYYPPPPPPAERPAGSGACWFPLFWPFCAAGAVVGTAGAIATAPFRAAAGDVVVTTPGVVASPPPAVVVAPPVAVAPPAPGVIVSPGDAERHLDNAARAQEKADQALEDRNYGIAEEQQEKARRERDTAERDSTGTVTVIPR